VIILVLIFTFLFSVTLTFDLLILELYYHSLAFKG